MNPHSTGHRVNPKCQAMIIGMNAVPPESDFPLFAPLYQQAHRQKPTPTYASSMLLTSQDRAIFPQNLADFAQFYLKSGQIPKKTGIAFDRDFF